MTHYYNYSTVLKPLHYNLMCDFTQCQNLPEEVKRNSGKFNLNLLLFPIKYSGCL
jgi:phage-related protein